MTVDHCKNIEDKQNKMIKSAKNVYSRTSKSAATTDKIHAESDCGKSDSSKDQALIIPENSSETNLQYNDSSDEEASGARTPPLDLSVADDTPLTPRSKVKKMMQAFDEEEEDESDVSDSNLDVDLSQIRKTLGTKDNSAKYYESIKLAYKYRGKKSLASSTSINKEDIVDGSSFIMENTVKKPSTVLLNNRQSQSMSFLMCGKLYNGASDNESDELPEPINLNVSSRKLIIDPGVSVSKSEFSPETKKVKPKQTEVIQSNNFGNGIISFVSPFKIQEAQDIKISENAKIKETSLVNDTNGNNTDRESDSGADDKNKENEIEKQIVDRKSRSKNAISPPSLSDFESGTALNDGLALETTFSAVPLNREERIRNLAEKKRRQRELERKQHEEELADNSEGQYGSDAHLDNENSYSDSEMGKPVSSIPNTQRIKKASKKELEENERTMQKIHRSLQLAPKVESKPAMTVNDFISQFNRKKKQNPKNKLNSNNILKELPEISEKLVQHSHNYSKSESKSSPQIAQSSIFTDTIVLSGSQAMSNTRLLPAFESFSKSNANRDNTGYECDSSIPKKRIAFTPTKSSENKPVITLQRTPNDKSPPVSKLSESKRLEKNLKKLNLLMTPRRLSSYLESRRIVRSPKGYSDKSDLDLGSDSNSDYELELVPKTELDQKPLAFRKLEQLSGKKIHSDQPKKKGALPLNNSSGKKNTKSLKDHKLELAEKLRRQVIAERKEKIDAIKARGGYVEDKKDFDSTSKIVESLLEHELKKNEELRRKEMRKSKKEFFDEDENDEEDEDWMDDIQVDPAISDSEFIEKEVKDEVMDSDYGEDENNTETGNSDLSCSENENEENFDKNEEKDIDEESAIEAKLEVPSSQKPAPFNEHDEDEEDEISTIKRVKVKRSRRVFSDDEGEEDLIIKATQLPDNEHLSLNNDGTTGFSQFFMASSNQSSEKSIQDNVPPLEETVKRLRKRDLQVLGYEKNKSLFSQQILEGHKDQHTSSQLFSNYEDEERFKNSSQISDTQTTFIKPYNLFMPTQLSQFSDPSQDSNVITNELSTQVDDDVHTDNYKTLSNFKDRFDDESTQLDSDEPNYGRKTFLLKKKLPAIENTRKNIIIQETKAKSNKKRQFNKKTSAARGIVDEEAFESEDEYAGIGGVSDDDSDGEVDSEVEKMMNDDNDENINKNDILQKHAELALEKDTADINKLLDDINGGFRRKRTNIGLFDLSSDEEDINTYGSKRERKRKRERLLRRRKESMLNANDKLSALANNPKANAFVDAIADMEADNAVNKYLEHLQPDEDDEDGDGDEDEDDEDEDSENNDREEGNYKEDGDEERSAEPNDEDNNMIMKSNRSNDPIVVEGIENTQGVDFATATDKTLISISSVSSTSTQSVSTSDIKEQKIMKTKTIGLKRRKISKKSHLLHVRSTLSEIFAEDNELGNDVEEDDEPINDGGYYNARRYDEDEATQLLSNREPTIFEDAFNENSDNDSQLNDNDDDLKFTSNDDTLSRHLALRRDRKRRSMHIDPLAISSQTQSMDSTQLIDDDILSSMPSTLPIKRVTSSFRLASMAMSNGTSMDDKSKKEVMMSISNKAPSLKYGIMTKGIRHLGKNGGSNNSMNKRTGIAGLKRKGVAGLSLNKSGGKDTPRNNSISLLKSINKSGMFS